MRRNDTETNDDEEKQKKIISWKYFSYWFQIHLTLCVFLSLATSLPPFILMKCDVNFIELFCFFSRLSNQFPVWWERNTKLVRNDRRNSREIFNKKCWPMFDSVVRLFFFWEICILPMQFWFIFNPKSNESDCLLPFSVIRRRNWLGQQWSVWLIRLISAANWTYWPRCADTHKR